MMQPAVILAAVLASMIAAMSLAAPQKPEKPAPPEKVKAEVSAKKIKGPKRNGQTGREFPVMFDIVERAQKVKAEKVKEEKETQPK
jgi:hypothetical protein